MKNSLRMLRAERNWSQADLAEKLGVSRQSVNAIETGRFDPQPAAGVQAVQAFCSAHRDHLFRMRTPQLNFNVVMPAGYSSSNNRFSIDAARNSLR